uniref:Fucolectin-6-like n=1 Tax=Sinocyclocheilus rhinocerous TaxID=307959 RepID=A0A673K8R5_9TELE
ETLPCVFYREKISWMRNVALKGVAHQSVDLLNRNTAFKAVDGNRAANLANDSCTYITAKSNPWWRVTLQQPYKIVMVSITNWGDCCADRISGAEIRIGNSLVNDGNQNQLVYSMLPGKTRKFKFSPVEGQYVNVLLPGVDRILTLCEVEVYAINVAPNGRATQSSVNRGSTACLSLAQNAIDGNRQYDLLKGSCTQTDTESNPWWRVDLMKTYTIASVALTNRGDCCSEQLNGVVIHIGDSLESEGRTNPVCVKVSFIPAGGTGTFRCGGALQGRYVTLTLPGENRTLSLCEVEVFGLPTE